MPKGEIIIKRYVVQSHFEQSNNNKQTTNTNKEHVRIAKFRLLVVMFHKESFTILKNEIRKK